MRFDEPVKWGGIGWWLIQVLPPLTILSLAFLPMDIGTSMFWLPAVLAALISGLWLLARLIHGCMNWNGWEYLVPPPRPLMTVLAMGLVIASLKISKLVSEREALSAAQVVQRVCDRQRQCPDSVPGWIAKDWTVKGGGVEWRAAPGWLFRFPMMYRVAADRASFDLQLRFNIDEGVTYRGGVGKTVAVDADEF